MSSIDISFFNNQEENNLDNLNVNSVDDFFDNIVDYEEDFSFIRNNEDAFYFAKKRALENVSNSSTNGDFEDEIVSDNQSETTISTDVDTELEIAQIINTNLSKCVIIDVTNGKLQRCNSDVKLRGLWQLIGTWQLDNNAVLQAGKDLDKLGVCYSHFMFDQNQLHEAGAKGEKDIRQSLIHSRRCRFCGKDYYFFSREKYCNEHSWKVLGKEIRLACICQKGCDAIKRFDPIIIPTNSNDKYNKTRYVCCKCYEENGGHLYIKPGRGKKGVHCNETKNHSGEVAASLELMANWILQVAYKGNSEFQKRVLTVITPALQLLNLTNNIDNSLQTNNSSFSETFNDINNSSQANNLLSERNKNLKIPSLFMVKLIFKLYQINLNKINSKNCYLFGNELAESLLKNRQHLHNNKVSLENPQSLDEYQNAIPAELYDLFEGMVGKLLSNRCQIANRVAKSRNEKYIPKEINQKKVQKISTMLSSIILTIGFTNTPFWLTQSLTSLCRKPRLLSSLHQVLESVSIISHSISHERKLEALNVNVKSSISNTYWIKNLEYRCNR